MTVDRAWAKRNLGFDPIATAMPENTFAFAEAASAPTPENIQREIIDFDSFDAPGHEFLLFSKATGLSAFTDIPWPAGLVPMTDGAATVRADGSLPNADVLVVTWTVDEGHALSRVLTPGKDSRNDYLDYTHNFGTISQDMRAGCPALKAGRLGAFWTGKIGTKSILVFKSESHMSQDGPKLPNATIWKQIIEEVQPTLVITTGTGGGIGADEQVGDVVVSPIVRFDCTTKFKSEPFAEKSFACPAAANETYFATAKILFDANKAQLPADNTRVPEILVAQPADLPKCIVTTDFFGIDISDDHYKLQSLGALCEMGDAVLGMVASEMPAPPDWVAVRNVSDPQIKAEGTLEEELNMAAAIYKAYGRWSSVCSAIVCWALVAAMA